MTNFAKAPTLSNETINTVESIEAQVVTLRGDKKASDEAINAHKVNQYAELIAAIAADRKPNGKFERGYGTKLKSDLHEFAGIPEATAKRLGENAVNAVKLIHDKIGDIPTQYTADAAKGDLESLGATSENKLVKAIKENRGGAIDKVEKLARSVVGYYGTTVNKDTGDTKVNKASFLNGLSDEDLETFEARIAELIEVRREFAAASEAAQAAEEAKKAENEAVKAAEAALANAA
jgi:hypothetical protein